MKAMKAMKNVRLFKNAQNGKPKRVKTVTDDYGNRVHIVNGKVKPALSKFAVTRRYMKSVRMATDDKYRNAPLDEKNRPKLRRHQDSKQVRLWVGHNLPAGQKQRKNYLKSDYHTTRADAMTFDNSTGNSSATKLAKKLHKGKRKAKDFTK